MFLIIFVLLFVSQIRAQKNSDALYEETSVSEDPKIYYLSAVANISNRFATTLITCRMKNPSVVAKEATFSVTLPEKAFISGFIMEINNKSYTAFVEEKRKAQEIYDKAVDQGQSAAQVKVSVRDSKKFTVSVNLEPEQRAVFKLKYEEFLARKLGQYELVMNIHPGQPVKNLNLEAVINEVQPLSFVKNPIIRRSSKINDKKLPAKVKIERTARQATIKFSPDIFEQQNIAKNLETGENLGLSGQFVVQYDVDRNASGGEIVQTKTHFAHFFVPKDVPTLPKYLLFVLDTSFSMYGTKLDQLKVAMNNILSTLKPEDHFNLIEFNYLAQVWDVNEGAVTFTEGGPNPYGAPIENPKIPKAHPANQTNIEAAKSIINLLADMGGTDIYSGLLAACKVMRQNQEVADKAQTMIIFLTDGDSTSGVLDYVYIINSITEMINKKAALFTLSLGEDANRFFLEEISLRNGGQTKHIYEDDDISLQLDKFFKELSSPLLKNITFDFKSGVKETSDVNFNSAFKDSELVVVGEKEKNATLTDDSVDVRGQGNRGLMILKPSIETSTDNMERLWAYVKVKQLLDQRKIAKNKTVITQKALDLALKHSFVTEVTSLVVVKPKSSEIVDPEDDDKKVEVDDQGGSGGSSGPSSGNRPFGDNSYAHLAPPTYPELEIIALLKKRLPWLDNILSDKGRITNSNGTHIYLQLFSKVGSKCRTQNLQTGNCKAVKDCDRLLFLISNLETFMSYSCEIDDTYTGLCC